MAASTNFKEIRCSIARSFAVFGDPWKALVIRDAHLGLTRFDQLVEDLGVSRKVLTERLNDMVDDQLIERVLYQTHPPRYDYVLTERGRDLVPVVLAAMAWGDRWLADNDGVPAITIHTDHECTVEILCSTCHERVLADDITASAGPGARVGRGTALIGRQTTHGT